MKDHGKCLNEDSFGPIVRGCRDDFDFTQKFERITFVILPASCFIVLSLARIMTVLPKPRIVYSGMLMRFKLAFNCSFAVLQIALLILTSTHGYKPSPVFVISDAFGVATSLCLITVSALEHSRSLRPSILLGFYLCCTLLLDVAITRTLWLAITNHADRVAACLFTASVAVKLAITILEAQQKRRWPVRAEDVHSPDETSGLYSIASYSWLNSILMQGYRTILHQKDIFPMPSNMKSTKLYTTLSEDAQQALHGQAGGLAILLSRKLWVRLSLPILPRLALTGFSFSQTFVTEAILNYISSRDEKPRNIGYGLIGAAFFIYSGIAVSTAIYWYLHEQALYTARGCLCTAVFRKTTYAKPALMGESAAVTLMSTDVERVVTGLLNLHEFWANTVEIAIASWLLKRKLGTAFVAPICIAVLSTIGAVILSQFTGKRQRAWMEQIQKRVGLTAKVISNMKQLKMSGLATPVEDAVQMMRLEDLRVGSRFRGLQIISLCLSYYPSLISPVITLGVTSATLDTTTMFTATSYLVLLTLPLSNIFRFLTSFLAAFTCLGRIQVFLEAEARADFRKPSSSELSSVSKSDHLCEAVRVINGSFGWSKEGEDYILKNINCRIPSCALTIIVGPVASGKSTLCKALLGETSAARGNVIMGCNFDKIGYCDQTPFLWNTTIKENIIGFSPYNSKRYTEVLEASTMNFDLSFIPSRDDARVGSNGSSLSGGQRQRVSIARALYLECEVSIFDDVLSGLDLKTEQQVFQRVFSKQGILKSRGATTILCTHSAKHLPAADHIIVIGADGRLVEEGTFEELVANKQYVYNLGINPAEHEEGTGSTDLVDGTTNIQALRTDTNSSTGSDDVNNMARQNGDIATYKHYFNIIGNIVPTAFVFSSLAYGMLYNFPTIWMKYWAVDVSSPRPHHAKSYWIGIYAMSQVLAVFFNLSVAILGLKHMIQLSGAALHLAALQTVVRAPLRFFSTAKSGVVINLFSQDMTLIDGMLPSSMLNLALGMASALGMMVVIATSSPYLAITYPFLLVVLYLIQKFYLRTSRQLRLLDLEAKSPLYAHFLDTIRGITTIRALGWVDANIVQSHQIIDASQRPAYLFAMIQRWLGFTLNVVTLFLSVTVVTLSTQLKTTTGFTGSALVTLISLSRIMTQNIQFFTQMETSMGAISRLTSFSKNTSSEILPGEDFVPSKSWPLQGRIEFKGVSATYDETQCNEPNYEPNNLILRDLDFTIESGKKVAICGRSGSGKSSIILILLRLLDPIPSCSHNICIDGVPLHTIDRATLRERLIAVPQDAVFLPDGTSFRMNLDPVTLSTELECQSVMEDLGLWGFVQDHGGLSAGMYPDTLSHGQQQLFCVARAIIKSRIKSRHVFEEGCSSPLVNDDSVDGDVGQLKEQGPRGILLLDEVGSSMDTETARIMQNVIEREFDGYTIVMVSHRLEMAMNFHQVLVMDSGRVVEIGKPAELVSKDNSRFRELYLAGNQN